MAMTPRTIVERIAAPAALAACAVIEFLVGGNALPQWTANLAAKTGIGTDGMLRGLIAAQAIGAAFALIFPRLRSAIAWLAFTAFAFSGLAELSALVNAPGDRMLPPTTWIAPFVALAVGIAGVFVLAKAPPTPPNPRRPLGAWQVFVALFVAAGAIGVAGRATLAPRTAGPATMSGSIETVMLNIEEWVGRTVPETGLGKHLPLLTAATLEGTKWIVFYQPSCGRCHEVFRTYFKGPQGNDVIGVVVPHAPDADVLPSDQPSDVECEQCIRMSLPEGKRWIVTTPTIVRIEGGRVTCVTNNDYDRCRPGSGTLP
jgi:hypothetical protein